MSESERRQKFIQKVWVAVWPKGTTKEYPVWLARNYQPIHGAPEQPFFVRKGKRAKVQGSFVAVFDTKKEALSWMKQQDYIGHFLLRRAELRVQ